MKKTLLLFFAFIFSLNVNAQFATYDFDGTGTNPTLVGTCSGSGTGDYLGIVNETAINKDYTGDSGNFYGAQDTNGSGTGEPCAGVNSGTATFSGINITGNTNIVLCFDIAGNDTPGWDSSSDVTFSSSIDAGSSVDLISFQSNSSTANQPASVDCDGDGTGDGVTNIGIAFQTFCVSIPGTGNSMDLVISIAGLDSGNEDVAIDNLEFFSDESAGTPGALACSSCGATLGTPTFTCLANTAGVDGVTVNIPYTGSDAGITSVTSTSAGTVGGDDPATTADGTITITGLNEGDAWDILLNGGDCDGITDSGTISATECPAALVCPNAGDLIITEIMYNPSGTEPAFEWFEVCNTTAAAIDMDGMEIGDNTVTNHTISGTLTVPANGCIVIAHTSVCGGITPDYTHGAFSLNQGGDDVEIICGGTTIDIVTYDGGPNFPSEGNGESIQFDPAAAQNSTANDMGSNWCVPLATTTCGASDLASPGVANPACALPPCTLVVTVGTPECATNTSGGDLYSVDVDFTGGGTDVFTINPGVAGASVVYEENPDTDTEGKFTIVDLPEGTNLSFTITSTNGCSIPVMATSPTCDCTGAGGGACGNTGDITITEIMYDPCSAGTNFWPNEGDGEYVEICNCGATTVDISKWQLRDEASRGDGVGSSYYTFPDMTELAAGECAVVANTPVFTALSPASGYQLFDRNKSNAELDNSGATASNEAGLYLIAFDGTLIDEVVWDDPNAASPAFPSCAGQNDGISLVLMDCSLDNSIGSNWFPSFNGGDGVAGGGTPGTANTAAACIDNVALSVSPTCNGDDAEFTVSFDFSYAYLNPNITFDVVRTDGASEVVLGTSSAQTASSGTGVTIMGTVVGPTAAASATVEIRVTGQAANSCFSPEVNVSIPSCPLGSCTYGTGGLYITELSYNPSSTQGDDINCEYIEIFNAYNATVDLEDWELDDPVFTFPAGASIASGEYIIVADGSDFSVCDWSPHTVPAGTQIFYWGTGNLGNAGESVTLSSPAICPATGSSVTYDDGANGADGDGNSLQIDPTGTITASAPDPGSGNCTASTVAPPSCALPVELVYFNARKDGNIAVLSWQTASEENNDFFSIEYSTDGITFREIGIVDGAGTTLEIQNYQYEHTTPSIGTNYYRLRQVDFSEEFAYSNIEVLVFEEKNNDIISIRPTIGKNIVTLIANREFSTESNILIYNATGILVKDMRLTPGSTELEINISDLSAGHYFVKVIGDNVPYATRFIKQ